MLAPLLFVVNAVTSPGPALYNVSTSAELAAAVRKMPDKGGEIRLAPATYLIAEPLIVRKSDNVITCRQVTPALRNCQRFALPLRLVLAGSG